MSLLFSQRKGFSPIKSFIQKDFIDKELRNSLWNAFTIHFCKYADSYKEGYRLSSYPDLQALCERIWNNHFKQPLDEMDSDWHNVKGQLRKYFFDCIWYKVYDLIEFIANNCQSDISSHAFISSCNNVLKRELSAYMFVDKSLCEITSGEEIREIEQAMAIPVDTVSAHLSTALQMLADRNAPDYRNSIKESISAVESLCKKIAKNNNATLDNALSEIKTKMEVHPALEAAFRKLYGYTNDADGIRHALKDKTTVDIEDAKFMLIAASAFINYLIVKAAKANLPIK